MNSTITKLTQSISESAVANGVKRSVQDKTARLFFLGIVTVALCCWLMLVVRISNSLLGPTLSASAIIFLVSIQHVINPKNSKK